MTKTQLSPGRFVLAFALAGLIMYGYTLIPHSADYTKEMKQITHTPRGAAVMIGAVICFSFLAKLIFVDLWLWRETRRSRKKTDSNRHI